MKPNGTPGPEITACGFYRVAGGWWLELGLQLDEETQRFLPFVRWGQGSAATGPWVAAHLFCALATAARSLIELVEAGVFIPIEAKPPPGPRLLDALGGPLPESPA